MDFLKTVAQPQPVEHVHLLLFMMNLVFIMLIPYMGFLLGTSILSFVYNRRGREQGNPYFLHFSRILIDIGAASKELIAFLAIIPSLSLVLLLSQLLQGTAAIAPGLMAFGFLFLLAGTLLLYAYKFTFHLSGILELYGEALVRQSGAGREELEDLSGYMTRNERTHLRAGKLGIVFLGGASVLTVGAIMIAGNPAAWTDIDTVFDLLFSGTFWIEYFQFLVIAGASTGVGILFFLFAWQGGNSAVKGPVGELARSVGTRLATWSLFLQPFALIGTVIVLPTSALAGPVFGLSGLVLILFFAIGHFLYAFRRDPRPGYAAYAFYTLALAAITLVTRDQLALSYATRSHSVQLATIAERETDALREKLGVVLVKALSGQEIYDSRCSACHLFEIRKIGPAYKDVVPKYAGRKAQMIAFVMNPVKVDPAFPSMPNQGLRPAEADSIVSFLLSKFTVKPTTQQPGAK